MSLFDNPAKNNLAEKDIKSGSPVSNESCKILNVPLSSKEEKNKIGLWTDNRKSYWEEEIIVAVREVTVEKLPVALEDHLQQSPNTGPDLGGSVNERVRRESGFASGDERGEKDNRKTSDQDLIPLVFLSEHTRDEEGPKWVLPDIEDDTLDDNMSSVGPTRIYDAEICGLYASDDDVELPKFDNDSANSDAGDDNMKPNKSGLYGLIWTNNNQDTTYNSNVTSPAWSSPNSFSPISTTSDMSLPPTPVSPAVPKTPPNSGRSPVSQSDFADPQPASAVVGDEPIYAMVDLNRKRNKQSHRNSLSVEGSFDGSVEGSESGRRSPFKVTFTDYRGSPVPFKKSIL